MENKKEYMAPQVEELEFSLLVGASTDGAVSDGGVGENPTEGDDL